MPTLPNSLVAVRAAVAVVLFYPHHAGTLYNASGVAAAFNIAADVDGNAEINAKIDVTLLFRAFSNNVDEYALQYEDYFRRQGDIHILYV